MNNRLELPFANKSLGQHFLKDQNIIQKICNDFKNESEAILEIGPGPGILTEFLELHKKPFHVIEMDTRFSPYLLQFIKLDQILFSDALKINLSEHIQNLNLNKNLWLVSNLPYNVATPLFINFIKASEIKFMTLMFQSEVADKIFPFKTTKNFMSSLLVLNQTYFDCQLLTKVAPGAFLPPPKVDSAVLSFTRKQNPIIELSELTKFEKFLRFIFSQKRKQLMGILKSQFNFELIQKNFKEHKIIETIRAEALTYDQVLSLYKGLTIETH